MWNRTLTPGNPGFTWCSCPSGWGPRANPLGVWASASLSQDDAWAWVPGAWPGQNGVSQATCQEQRFTCPIPAGLLKPRVGGGLHGYSPEIRSPLDLGWVLWAPCSLRTGKRRLRKPAHGSTEASRLSPPARFLFPTLSCSSPFPPLSQHSEPLGSLSDRSELRPLSQTSGTGRDFRDW